MTNYDICKFNMSGLEPASHDNKLVDWIAEDCVMI